MEAGLAGIRIGLRYEWTGSRAVDARTCWVLIEERNGLLGKKLL